jgi:RES domain-containing protein
MAPADVAKRLNEFLSSQPKEVILQIPSGTGICSIANTEPSNWVSGFTSNRPGRWSQAGQPTKYFGEGFQLCAAELFGTDASKLNDVVCERWQTTGTIRAFDISKFPDDLKTAFYEDKGLAPTKWTKPHLFIDAAKAMNEYSDVRSIFAPSASGKLLNIDGCVFTADPKQQPLQLIETGTYRQMIQPNESESA